MSSSGLGSEVRIAPMELSELEQVIAIETDAYPNPWSYDAFRREIESNEFAVALVATSTRAPVSVVGYCVCWYVDDHVQIQNVTVHASWRRQGIGAALIERALHRAEASRALRAELEVRRSNTAALRLYKTLGFERAGERKNYYRDPAEDALLLVKQLDRA